MAEDPNISNALYQPLPPGYHMRVLSLEPPSVEGERRYFLRCRRIDDDPYLALSYRWQKDERQPCITVNGRRVSVMQTVKDFLDLHLGNKTCGEIFIDSICINQQDLGERASQVRLMGQIYSSAAKVCIWLGLDLSIKERSALRTALDWTDDGPLPQRGRFDFAAEVFMKEYWKRAWVMQEIVLAKEIELCWGGLTLSEAVVHKAGNTEGLLLMNPDITLPMEVLAQRHGPSRDILPDSLAQLLCVYQYTEATDVRDKVYAMLSMARNDATKSTLPVDYSTSKCPADVFCDVMDYCDVKPSTRFFFAVTIARSLGLDPAAIRASPRALHHTICVRGWIVGSVQGAGNDFEDHQLQTGRSRVADYGHLRPFSADLKILAWADDVKQQPESTMTADNMSMSPVVQASVGNLSIGKRLYPATDLVSTYPKDPHILSQEILQTGDVIVNFAAYSTALVLRKGPGHSYSPIGGMRSNSGWRIDVVHPEGSSKRGFIDGEPVVEELTAVGFRMNLLAVVELDY